MTQNSATDAFLAARDFLLSHRGDYEAAHAGFTWPRPERFNWALDWFDRIAAGNGADALRIVEEDGTSHGVTFEELSGRSASAANWLRAQGVAAGDRILVMLGNQRELWEVMLGAMKLRAVVIPATPLLGPADLRDRVDRGLVRHVITRAEDTAKFDEVPGTYTRIAAGAEVPTGWRRLEDMYQADENFSQDGETLATDPLMLYFTSGTTDRPKLVEHTHASYPIGHLSTMYWLGLRPGDVHLNIASPGWAKHAWSNLFAPWNAGATVFVHNYTRFDADRLMAEMDRGAVTTFCAPPTVWRMLIQSDLTKLKNPPREAVAAGEPLNPEVIEKVRQAWGITIRDGFGQTETTLQVGNFPGAPVKPGSMGRPAPGYRIVLLDAVTGVESPDEGELCVDLRPVPAGTPAGVMTGYRDDPERTAEAMAGGLYRTGDIASRDADGYLTYVGRADDVFKASDYKISPFELESALLEHEAVAEAAVVPAPDALRLAVPKAYVTLAAGWEPDAETARVLFEHSRAVLSPYKRIRRIEFAELPKTVSGKIRRVELRELTASGSAEEYDEADL